MRDHLLYALMWLGFGGLHSLLATPAAKRLGCWLGRGYRLAYNLVALVHFALLAWVGAALLGDEAAFALPAWATASLLAVHLAGWALLLVAARGYDGARLLGLAQWRQPEEPEDEPLRVGGLNGWVRHPLYVAGLLILWGASVSPLGLATALWGSLYLAAGAACEERKLLRLYGSAYADYRRAVPAFVPRFRRSVRP